MAQLRKRGLIAAVVCSDSFMKLGTAQAKVFGVPDLPLIEFRTRSAGSPWTRCASVLTRRCRSSSR